MKHVTHPEFYQHGTYEHLKLGRKTGAPDARTLRLENYLDESCLPAIPAMHDYTYEVPSWPMYGNDVYGDCTIAAAGHMIQAWTESAGAEAIPDSAAILAAYWATGDGTDDGRVETDVLNYWRKTGIAGHKIGAYVSVDPKNTAHMKAAIYLFGGVYTGIALPVTAQKQRVWDVVGDGKTGKSAPGSWGGHAVPYEQYDSEGVTVVTWGGTLRATWKFNNDYTEEAYAILSPDFLKNGKSPEGFDQAALLADLKNL